MAATRVMGAIGTWNIDQGRYGIEMLPSLRHSSQPRASLVHITPLKEGDGQIKSRGDMD